MCDISVKIENKKFNFRVALVPYKDGKILVQNSVKDGYLSLVGGRVKLNETTIEAVKRETEEELGFELDASKLSLIKVCENFFTYNDKDFHEILFVYKFNWQECENFNPIKIKDKTDVEADWIDISTLKDANIKPAFMKEFNLGNGFDHIIIK